MVIEEIFVVAALLKNLSLSAKKMIRKKFLATFFIKMNHIPPSEREKFLQTAAVSEFIKSTMMWFRLNCL